MIEFTMMRHADRDIEYRITEVEVFKEILQF